MKWRNSPKSTRTHVNWMVMDIFQMVSCQEDDWNNELCTDRRTSRARLPVSSVCIPGAYTYPVAVRWYLLLVSEVSKRRASPEHPRLRSDCSTGAETAASCRVWNRSGNRNSHRCRFFSSPCNPRSRGSSRQRSRRIAFPVDNSRRSSYCYLYGRSLVRGSRYYNCCRSCRICCLNFLFLERLFAGM